MQKLYERKVYGGNCIKFTDNNAIFTSFSRMARYVYRKQLIDKYGLPKLSGLGVKVGDFINIKNGYKEYSCNKGVNCDSYPNELLTEEQPTNPPAGYFDVNNLSNRTTTKQSCRWLLFKFRSKCFCDRR